MVEAVSPIANLPQVRPVNTGAGTVVPIRPNAPNVSRVNQNDNGQNKDQGGQAGGQNPQSFTQGGGFLAQLLAQQSEASNFLSAPIAGKGLAAYQIANARSGAYNGNGSNASNDNTQDFDNADISLPDLPPRLASGRVLDLTV